MSAEARNRAIPEGNAMGASDTVSANRDREPADVGENTDESIRNQGKRCCAGDPHLAFVSDKDVVKGYAQLWNPDLKSRSDATQASVLVAVGATTSAWVAEECYRV